MILGVFLTKIVFLELFLVEGRMRADSKIVGGYYVRDLRQMPWIVDIKNVTMQGEEGHFCGGSVLTPIFVLTACHCLGQVSSNWSEPSTIDNPKDYVFVAGSLISGSRVGPHAQVRQPQSFSIHPKCREINEIMRNDFGVALLAKPFEESNYVRRISILSTDGKLFSKLMYSMFAQKTTSCYVAGWGEVRRGETDDMGVMSKRLKMIKMFVITENECRKSFGRVDKRMKKFPFKKHQQICATSKKMWGSDCQGDSGGPFVCGGYQVGVVSYGIDCGISLPAVYAGMGIFFEWYSSKVLPMYARGELRKSSAAVSRTPRPHFKIYIALYSIFRLYYNLISVAI